ncbi:unnamed protein product, partial [Symbiodinium microadriaticum]
RGHCQAGGVLAQCWMERCARIHVDGRSWSRCLLLRRKAGGDSEFRPQLHQSRSGGSGSAKDY